MGGVAGRVGGSKLSVTLAKHHLTPPLGAVTDRALMGCGHLISRTLAIQVVDTMHAHYGNWAPKHIRWLLQVTMGQQADEVV